jgi:hypothetical protein
MEARLAGEAVAAVLFLYNLRHLQHAGQLNLMLRQRTDSAPRWVAAAQSLSARTIAPRRLTPGIPAKDGQTSVE